MSDFTIRNRMSAGALKDSQHARIDVVESPKTGKLFFQCGTIKGYIVKKLASCYKETPIEDVEYGEILSTQGETAGKYVPCLFLKGKNNVKHSW